MNSSFDLKRIILEACVLLSFGALFGLTLNYQLVIDAFSGELAPQRNVESQQESTSFPMPVLLDDMKSLLSEGALVVDARSPELFNEGHIKGAVSLPLIEIDRSLPGFLATINKGQMLIIYCSGFGCPDSFDLGMLLIEENYTDVWVYEGGFPEWHDAGLPVEGGGNETP